MAVRAVEGFVEHGKIRLPEGVSIAENTLVYVIVPEKDARLHIRTPRLAHPEEAKSFQKQVVEVTDDAKV